MSDPIRELEIVKAQFDSLRTDLATKAELLNSQGEILHAVAVERDAAVARAEKAEANLAAALGADEPEKPATPTQRARFWAMEAVLWKSRADTAEAQLALVNRYGADQWRRGNAGKDPQEFAEWKHFRR